MSDAHQQVFQQYIVAGAINRDPAAVAALFTEDGGYETPLDGRRFAGRDAVRQGVAAVQAAAVDPGALNAGRSRSVLHETADPDVFIAEIDAVFDTDGGDSVTMSLVQIFRIRDGQIAMLRDYFAPEHVT